MRAFGSLLRDARGSIAIETAIVAPVLAMLSVGGFEVSAMVAKQTELQSAASEAESIALASPPDDAAERATLKNVIAASTGLEADEVTVTERYRCGDAAAIVTSDTVCNNGVVVWKYVEITLATTYTPTWNSWGLGDPIDYNVVRRVMIPS
jgi:Flp pilus assembly protein TadG